MLFLCNSSLVWLILAPLSGRGTTSTAQKILDDSTPLWPKISPDTCVNEEESGSPGLDSRGNSTELNESI